MNLRRYWINCQSKFHPYHCFNGRVVLAPDKAQGRVIAYALDITSSVISFYIDANLLSPWHSYEPSHKFCFCKHNKYQDSCGANQIDTLTRRVKMDLKQAAALIMKECEGIDLEMNITETEVDIYWKNLNLQVSPSRLKKTLKAIKYLHNAGAKFQ
jgi:serine/threonine protein kinase